MEENEDLNVDEGQEGADGADEGGSEGDGQEGDQRAAGEGEGDKKPSRAERQRDRAREHSEIKALREQLAEQNRQNLALQARIADGVTSAAERMAAAGERMIPKEKPLREKLKERLRAGATQIREDDPGSLDRYIDANMEAMGDLSREEARGIVAEEMKKFQRAQPQQMTAEERRLESKYAWIFSDDEWPAVKSAAKKLAAKESRNMSDPRVREATVAEAAALHAKQWGLPVAGGDAPAGNGRERVAGTGGRNGAGGGGGDIVANGAELVAKNPLARQQADKEYASIKDPKARYAKYFKTHIEPEMRQRG
jgi:hypothetical protein